MPTKINEATIFEEYIIPFHFSKVEILLCIG